MATPQEVEACKNPPAKLAAKDAAKSLVEIMVEAKVLTKNQSIRLLKRGRHRGRSRSSRSPAIEIIERLGKGSMGLVFKARQTSVDRDRRGQDPARHARAEQGIHQAIRARGEDRRQAPAQQHRQRDRRGRGRRAPLLRDGVRRRGDHQGRARQEQGLRREGRAEDRPRRRRGDEARPRARPDPPRHQARERDPHQGRGRQARRPRPRPAHGRREVGDVRGRDGDRHALLHQPRAGPRAGRRRHPGRHLQPRAPPSTTWSRARCPTTARPRRR